MTNNIATLAIQKLGISELNEMQQAVVGTDNKRDIILLSPTGSGKTLAFLLPILETFSADDKETQAIIIAPTRELALQIENVFRTIGSGYRALCCYGGHPLRTEAASLKHAPTLLIGTPGRILDHIKRGNIKADKLKTIVLDEFDKCLELGFQDEMEDILKFLPRKRRCILTSATEALDIPSFIGIDNPVRLNFLQELRTNKSLQLHYVKSPINDKLDTLYALLGELNGESALVFCNYRESVERVSQYLSDKRVDNEYFHGGMEQVDRERALSMFRNASSSIFISTDLAARGLDIPEVKNVIHYHLPQNEESYVHRNGRTARMNKQGNAFVIINSSETIPEYINKELKEFHLSANVKQPPKAEWGSLTINRGKRDKISKKDIVGFLYQQGKLEKDDIGIIEVKESVSYVAVKRDKIKGILTTIKDVRIKNMKARIY